MFPPRYTSRHNVSCHNFHSINHQMSEVLNLDVCMSSENCQLCAGVSAVHLPVQKTPPWSTCNYATLMRLYMGLKYAWEKYCLVCSSFRQHVCILQAWRGKSKFKLPMPDKLLLAMLAVTFERRTTKVAAIAPIWTHYRRRCADMTSIIRRTESRSPGG